MTLTIYLIGFVIALVIFSLASCDEGFIDESGDNTINLIIAFSILWMLSLPVFLTILLIISVRAIGKRMIQ